MLKSVQLKTILLCLVTLLLACFVIPQTAQALSPTPDGCYPNFTTAEGCDALSSLTTGAGNTGLGFRSLFLNSTGSFNTGVGGGALALNNADSNTAVGAAALLLNTIGRENTATGTDALVFNDSGSRNTANGAFALFSNTEGSENTASGFEALNSNTTGFDNTATGFQALFSNTTGLNNTANGSEALTHNTTGNENTATGFEALAFNTTGDENSAYGDHALFSNTEGNGNTASGLFALAFNETGNSNTAIGVVALQLNTTGSRNTAVGIGALENNTTGLNNIGLGLNAGHDLTTGNANIDIGNAGVPGESGTIRIGDFGTVQTKTFIAGIRGVQTVNAAIPVVIDTEGQLGTQSSSRRFKKEIKPMAKTSEAILALKPVNFHYKSDATGTPQYGLIAEEVAEVNPDLVVRDENGEIYTVRYDAVNAMLLNEFLKEHRKNEEQGATIARQQKQIDALTAGLQQVNAKFAAASPSFGGLEVSRPAGQTVLNTQ